MRRRLIPRTPLFSKRKRPRPAVSKHADGVQHSTRILSIRVYRKSCYRPSLPFGCQCALSWELRSLNCHFMGYTFYSFEI